MNLSVYFVTPDGVDDAIVLAAVRGGATVVQLRDKSATDTAMIAQARLTASPLTAMRPSPIAAIDSNSAKPRAAASTSRKRCWPRCWA